ncbi:SpoIIE family protein phosphatase [bacterium]|nr:SpoIIE family protein phosphatase [bacterium]
MELESAPCLASLVPFRSLQIPGAVVAYLKILQGADAGRIVPLDGERIVFGRHPSCDIVLEDGAVSRQHAQIVQLHGSYYLEDLRSRNGTQINDVDVTDPKLLADGDIVRVCDFAYSFVESGSSTDLFKNDTQLHATSDKSSLSSKSSLETAELETDSQERSSIISSIDARSNSGVRLSVKPEVKLRTIVEIGHLLNGVLNIDEVFPNILEALFRIYPQADQAVIMMVEEPGGEPKVREFRNRRSGDDSFSVSRTIVKRALESGEAILSADASDDSRFVTSESLAGLQIRSMMCAPLISQSDERLGAIQITTFDLKARFDGDDLDLLVTIASQCTLAIENAKLHQQLLKRRDMDRELEFAMQVQLGFLPSKRPKLKDYDFADFYEAAQHVGGDYYDYVALPDGRIAVTVADVAGKGVPAALLMARLYSAARYHLLTSGSAAEAMEGLNSEISVSGLGHRFITCALLVIAPAKHTVTLVSAGHLAPIRRNLDGKVDLVESEESGLPLGIIPDQKFVEDTYELQPGDTWVLYTDGVTEAMNTTRELYGSKRLAEFIRTGPLEIGDLISAIVADVAAFSEGNANSDDLCLVGFQRTP